MKSILRKIAIYTFTLYITPMIIPGLDIEGGLLTLFIGGVGLALMFLILKPILSIISFPINFVTMGMFSILTNAFIIYLLTRFVPGISISVFSYPSFSYSGFQIPTLSFNVFFAFVFCAFVISLIESSLAWLMD